MKFKTAVRTVAAVTCFVVLSACGSGKDAVRSDGSVDLSKVTLTVGDQKGGTQSLLAAAGELESIDYEVDYKPFTSGPPLLEAVSSGAVDLGGVGNTPPLFAIDQDKDIRIVHAATQGAEGDTIVVPNDSPIKSVDDLKGKKVAVAKGSSANYHLLAQLAEAGLEFSDISPVWLQPSEALAAFSGGHVDAWAIWDPFTSQAELTADARVIATGESVVNGAAFQVASKQALDDPATRAAISDYLERVTRAQLWANENPGGYAKAWADETGLSLAITQRASARRDYAPQPVKGTLASEQQMWDAFSAQKQVGRDVELEPYFDGSFDSAVEKIVEEEK